MISSHRSHRLLSQINHSDNNDHPELTPLIDVVFILIVFLLLTANTRLLSLPVSVPQTDDVADAGLSDAKVVTVSIQAEQAGWYIEDQHYLQWSDFREQMSRSILADVNISVALAADKKADVQRFVKVLTFLQRQNVSDTRILVKED